TCALPISYRSAIGVTCSGRFFSNNMVGEGTCRYKDGTVYSGEFRKGLPEGRGVMNYPNGGRFAGEFRDGAPFVPGQSQQ
ncbi:MAG: hypothetical protein RLZZ511_482, partial [Cyanobacteriota bacterium]